MSDGFSINSYKQETFAEKTEMKKNLNIWYLFLYSNRQNEYRYELAINISIYSL